MEISKEFKQWLDAYGKDRSERKTVNKVVAIEDKHLFNGELLSDVILIAQKLMTEYGDVEYYEHWFDYETMQPSLTWNAEESDEEYDYRLTILKHTFEREQLDSQKNAERERLEKEMKALQQKLDKLK